MVGIQKLFELRGNLESKDKVVLTVVGAIIVIGLWFLLAEFLSKSVITQDESVNFTSLPQEQRVYYESDSLLIANYDKLEQLSREDLIKHFVSAEFNRFLDYYKNARDINVPDKAKRSSKERRSVYYSRLFINLGSKQNLTPTRLIGLVNESLNSSSASIGKIEILKNFSFFEIEEGITKQAIREISGQNFDGIRVSVEKSQPKKGGNDFNGRSNGRGASKKRRTYDKGERRKKYSK